MAGVWEVGNGNHPLFLVHCNYRCTPQQRKRKMACLRMASSRGLLAVSLAFLVLAVYCRLDPFRRGAMAHFPEFETYMVEVPPPSALPAERDTRDLLQRSDIMFHGQVQGPESTAFDPQGRGPYAGVADGRVLFWDGRDWSYFAHTSPYRTQICDPKPSIAEYLEKENVCGRPLGLRFQDRTGELYVADAYFGLMKVGPEGGLAKALTREAEGVPFNFTNDLDVDDQGNVYFTDSSTNFQRRNFLQLIFTSEPTGRLLKYNAATRETIVLLRGLQFPNGVSLSKDGSFLVFCEAPSGRLRRYWLTGEKAGSSEVFAILPGTPDNVRTNDRGEFWVAIHSRRRRFGQFFAQHPRLRKTLLKLPVPVKYHYLMVVGRLHGMVIKYSPTGEVLQVLEDRQGKVVRAVSQAEERHGRLWMGSILMPFIAVYNVSSS